MYPSISGTEGGGTAICNAYGIGAYPTHIIIAPDHQIIEQDIWPVSSPSDFIDPLENAGCEAHECDGGNPLAANFEADNVDPCDLTSVGFTSTSTGDITSYEWTFEGGTPASSTEENPVILYETAGVYDVSLTVISGFAESTIVMEDYITVHNCTGVETEQNLTVEITPNPTDGIFQLTLPYNGLYDIQIFDVTGHLVHSTPVNEKISQMDLSYLKPGVYILNAQIENLEIKERIVIK